MLLGDYITLKIPQISKFYQKMKRLTDTAQITIKHDNYLLQLSFHKYNKKQNRENF